MVLVQKLSKKAADVVTVKDLSVCFNDTLMNLTRHFDEVIVIFDTHRADSLKNRRGKRDKRERTPCSIKSEMRPAFGTSH